MHLSLLTNGVETPKTGQFSRNWVEIIVVIMAGLMDENKNVIAMIEIYLHRLIYYFHSVSQAGVCKLIK